MRAKQLQIVTLKWLETIGDSKYLRVYLNPQEDNIYFRMTHRCGRVERQQKRWSKKPFVVVYAPLASLHKH
jgi:hypothetical protein